MEMNKISFLSDILSILNAEDKKKFYIIIILILINIVLEIFGLGLILLINMVADKNFIFDTSMFLYLSSS